MLSACEGFRFWEAHGLKCGKTRPPAPEASMLRSAIVWFVVRPPFPGTYWMVLADGVEFTNSEFESMSLQGCPQPSCPSVDRQDWFLSSPQPFGDDRGGSGDFGSRRSWDVEKSFDNNTTVKAVALRPDGFNGRLSCSKQRVLAGFAQRQDRICS